MQDCDHMDRIIFHSIGDNIWKFRHDQFTRALDPSQPSHFWIISKVVCKSIDTAHDAPGSDWIML